jgi:hypothetical protein
MRHWRGPESLLGGERGATTELTFGAGKIDRRVTDVKGLVRSWREKERDWGQLYLEYQPITPSDRLLVEDLAVTC